MGFDIPAEISQTVEGETSGIAQSVLRIDTISCYPRSG